MEEKRRLEAKIHQLEEELDEEQSENEVDDRFVGAEIDTVEPEDL